MKKIAGLLGFLLFSGFAAFWASRSQNDMSDGQATVWDSKSDEIKELSYSSSETVLNIKRRSYEKNNFYWANFKKLKPPSEMEFLMTKRFEEYVKKFHPLIANRVFSNLTQEKITQFGFTGSVSRLNILNEKNITIEKGGENFGSEFFYARQENSRDIWLLGRDVFEDLENLDARYFEKNFLSTSVDDIKSVEFFTGDAKSKKILRGGKDADGTLGWQNGDGKASNPGFKNWIDKFARLRVVSYPSLKEIELVRSKFTERLLKMQIEGPKSNIEKLEFYGSAENQDYIFVQSNLFPVLFRLSRAKVQPLVDEYQKLVGF